VGFESALRTPRPGRDEASEVLTALGRIFAEEIARVTKRLANVADAETGAVSFPQRFGGSVNVHPHMHTIAVDGVFEKTEAGGVRFHEAPPRSKDDVTSASRRSTKTRWSVPLAFLRPEK
jgi:hypothetical protein